MYDRHKRNEEAQLHLLMFAPDGWPTFRPDVAVLFGRYLPEYGITTDLVTHLTSETYTPVWKGNFYPTKGDDKFGKARELLSALTRFDFGKYDAIQVRDHPILALPIMLRAWMAGRPFYYWMSFPLPEMDLRISNDLPIRNISRKMFLLIRGSIARFVLDKLVLPKADHIFVQSDEMLKVVAARGIDPDCMTSVPMCIDPDRFADIPTHRGCLDSGRLTIGYLGTCDRARRVDFLFEVVACLVARDCDVQLLVIGDASTDSDRAWLAKRACDLKVSDRVEVTGWLSAPEAQKRLMDVDVAAALYPPDPLLDVGSPTKLIEYLAMEIPVVGNTQPDQDRVLRESNGGLSVSFDPAAFAEAVEQIIADPEAARLRAKAGRRYVLSKRAYPSKAVELSAIYKGLGRKHVRHD